MTDATTTGVAAVSPARVVAICAAVSALFAAIGWFALRPVAYTAVGAMADFAFIAIALLLVRPVFRSPARVLLLALALGFTFSFSLVLKSSLLGAPVYSSDLVALVALLGILSGWQWLFAIGVLALLVGVLAWSLAPRPGRSGWLLAGAAYIAALVLLAPWVLGYDSTAATGNDMLTGALVIAFSCIKGRVKNNIGGGWSSLWKADRPPGEEAQSFR